MNMTTLKTRYRSLDPVVVDIALAVGLALIVCLQIWFVTHGRPEGMKLPPNVRLDLHEGPRAPEFLAYLIAACAFLPLAFRRAVPWLALALSGGATIVYSLQPMPAAFVTLGPMIALFSVAAYSRRRHTGLIALVVVGVVIAVPVFAFSSNIRWIVELTGSFVLLAAAALFGEADRNRKVYIAEVEARAAQAERTRDEEARRRVDEERIRISREVHDIVAHSLSIVTIQAAAAISQIDTDPQGARESMENVRDSGRGALAELRSMLDVLRTGEGDAPLEPAADIAQIEKLVAPIREAGIAVNLTVEGDRGAVPAYASVSVYRIVQEALTNVVRHAGASRVDVRLEIADRDIMVEVRDDGRGLTAPADSTDGHGVRGMRERVEALSGSFAAGPDERGGFRVRATIPLTKGA
ncbi:MAG: sensor histidine kinase [Coriobacteriia bacterium]